MKVMGILDGQAGVSVGDVQKLLKKSGDDLAYTTVMTVLVRLHKKGFLAREKSGRQFLYSLKASKRKVPESLLDKVWGTDYSGDVKTVAVHVRWLRQKLETDPKNPLLIETVHRSGYRLNHPSAGEGQ